MSEPAYLPPPGQLVVVTEVCPLDTAADDLFVPGQLVLPEQGIRNYRCDPRVPTPGVPTVVEDGPWILLSDERSGTCTICRCRPATEEEEAAWRLGAQGV